MRELFERLGLEYRDDNKYILDTLQIKEVELLDRLDSVEQEDRRNELAKQLEEVESVINELLSKQPKTVTGIYRDVDDYADLKNGRNVVGNTKTDKEIFDELDGLLGTADYLKAIEKMETVGELGNEYAQMKLGYLFRYGQRVNKDLTKAVYWYEKAGNNGNGDAYNYIGVINSGEFKNYQKAYEYYKKAAECGSGWGYYNLGLFYSNGNNVVPVNKGMAFEYYKKAADLGADKGALSTGACYAKGIGVLQDDNEALKYFRIAAEKGNASAMDWLGLFYFQGRAVVKDLRMAADWYAKAADGGIDRANYDAANLFYALQDYQKALNYAIRARDKKIKGGDDIISKIDATGYVLPNFVAMAEKGYVEQQLKLARAYDSGEKGVDKNNRLAAEWYEKAALAGNPEAQYRIAQRYETGTGVEKDLDKAKKYFELSKKAGYVAPEVAEEKRIFELKRRINCGMLAQIVQLLIPILTGMALYNCPISTNRLTTVLIATIILLCTFVIQLKYLKTYDLPNRVIPLIIGVLLYFLYYYGHIGYSINEWLREAVIQVIPSLILVLIFRLKEDDTFAFDKSDADQRRYLKTRALRWLVCLVLSLLGSYMYYRIRLCSFVFDDPITYIDDNGISYAIELNSSDYEKMKRYAAYAIDEYRIKNGKGITSVDYDFSVVYYLNYFYNIDKVDSDTLLVRVNDENVETANNGSMLKVSFSETDMTFLRDSEDKNKFYRQE